MAAPKGAHALIPRTSGYVARGDLADMIKDSQMGEIILNHLGGPNVITEVLMSARRGQEEQSPRRRCDSRSKGQSDVIVERGHEPRRTGGPGSWKGNETDCPLEPPDGGVKQLSQGFQHAAFPDRYDCLWRAEVLANATAQNRVLNSLGKTSLDRKTTHTC